MLELRKITKIYETESLKQRALNKVDIKFRKSEFVSILGQSGSGKTTLLNIIGGLDEYTSGDLIINGISTKEYNDRDWDIYRNHRVGFVFQSYNLIPHQTALQNVELALTLSGVSKAERKAKAEEALKKVGLKEHMNKKPNQMSGGQMQRIAIARALVNDPDILLADEPTGALDSETSLQVMDLLKEVAKDKLVIMVTHNPELAVNYSTRIVKVIDGNIVDDTNPFDGDEKFESETEKRAKSKKTSMNFMTALSLSLNNLMTKKGRTILTAFAGSIGIIGIALILSLSNGINKYIERVEEETLSSYPLAIQKESIDMSSMLETMAGNSDKQDYDDDKIHSLNVMGDMLSAFSSEVKRNDLKSFKEYLDKNEEIKKYTSEIEYNYDITMNLYKDVDGEYVQVNPTTVMDAVGMGTSGISGAYSSYMSRYDVFEEMFNNDTIFKKQYDLVAGKYAKEPNEVMILVNENNEISDYTLYSIGLLDQKDLKEKFQKMVSGEEIEFESISYSVDDLLNISFKLMLNTDYYQKKGNVWINMKDDKDFVKKALDKSMDVKVVGIVKPNPESVSGNNSGVVFYRHSLVEEVISRINETEIVKEQISKPELNIFTGAEFSSGSTIDYSNLTPEQMAQFQKMSQEELAQYMASYSENASATYQTNLKKLGVSDLEDPDTVRIYPKDFDSKKAIEKIIEDYNKTLKEEDQITYTDVVGIMMSSVSTIVNVISSVLIAFVAISLVVSSIMIAIITYISVIERTKEIGILRAIGASKRDISRVFNAETLIEGFVAGAFGIITTAILNVPINIIIKNVVNISGIAKLPIDGAIILIVISILLTVIAGVIPAKIASKKDPVIALRTE